MQTAIILPSVDEVKRKAKQLRQENPKIENHNKALDEVSKMCGYDSWKKLKPIIEEQEEDFPFVLAINPFELMCQNNPLLEKNRQIVVEHVDKIVDNYLGAIDKYGSSQALAVIFIDEIALYYSSAFKIDKEEVQKVLNMFAYRLIAPDDIMPESCAITYPSFKYKKQGIMLLHIPVIRGFILEGHIARLMDIDYELFDNDNTLTLESIEGIMAEVAKYAVKKWSEGYILEGDEQELMEEKILQFMSYELRGACREEVVEEVIEEGGAHEDLRRILEQDIQETPMGTCMGGTSIVDELNAKYVNDEAIEKFKEQWRRTFGTVGKRKSPQFLKKHLLNYDDDNKIEKRLKGESDGGVMDMMMWLGDTSLDMSKLKHHPILKAYADVIKGKESYFGISTPTLIRCSLKKGVPSFEVSDLMPMISRDRNDYENTSFQTSRVACTKEEYLSYFQKHWDYCLENDLLPEILVNKVILSTEDRWFKEREREQ